MTSGVIELSILDLGGGVLRCVSARVAEPECLPTPNAEPLGMDLLDMVEVVAARLGVSARSWCWACNESAGAECLVLVAWPK